MKKLLFILTMMWTALLPVELWAQSTTGGDDGSGAVAAPTFRFDGDYLVIETATQDASIFYQMADLPDMSDETIEKVSSSITVTANIEQSNYYEQPIELKKSVVLKAIAVGATESEVSILVYDYDSWHKLQEAIEYGEKIQSLAQDNANVDEDLKEQLKWILYESMHFYEERAMMPYQEAQHFTNHIFEICAQIEQQMGGQTTAEPYAVLSENNTVLTFYYDEKKNERNGMSVGPFDGFPDYQAWYGQRESITTVVFDASFANCTSITSTACWFYGCNNLVTITDMKNLKTDNVTDMQNMFSYCSSLTSLNLSNFNTSNVMNMSWMFDGCSGLTSLDLSNFNTSSVADMVEMFSGCSGLTSLDLSNFNTSTLMEMDYMFSYCSGLKSLDLSSFNTSSVKGMEGMFSSCSALVTIYGNNWDVSKVVNGSVMFWGCTSLVGGAGTVYDEFHIDFTYAHIDGGSSNPGYFTDKNAPVIAETEPYAVLSESNTVLTFYYDDQKAARDGMDIGPYNGNSPAYMYDRWRGKFEDILTVVFDDSFANYTELTSTSYWFYRCFKLTTIIGIENLKTDNVTDMSYMFRACSALTSIDVSGFNTANVTKMDDMFLDCSNLTSLDLSNFDTANVKNMNAMFSGCTNLTNLNVSSFSTNDVNLGYMFEDCSNLTSLDLSSFNTSNVTKMHKMFSGCSALNTIYVSDGWSTSSVTNSENMFEGCLALVGGAGTTYDANHIDHTYAHIDGGPSNPGYFTYKNAPVIVETEPYAVLSENNMVLTFYYDDQKTARNGMSVGPFDGNPDYQAWYDQRESITSVVFDASFANCTTITSTAYWFYGCEKLTTITGISNLKTGNVTDMGCMFEGCSNLTSLDVSHFDTSLVEGMYFMFAKCSKLTNLDLSNFNTSNVKKMHYMFWDCSALQSIALSNFNTSNVIWMHCMFDGCFNLTSLDVSNFDTSNVTEIEDMFDRCYSLTSLDVSHFNTSKAKYLSAMFNDCRKLKSIDVSHFDTSNAESMLQMFAGCYSLTSLDVSNFNTAKVTNMKNMFSGCSNLVDINMSNFNTDDVTDMTDIFANCSSLASIQAGSAMIPANEYAKVENPNLLVYVNNEQYAPENIQNVVIGDFAKNIVLTDVTEGNGNFYCPQEFKAETITYSHEYNQMTEIDVARGWESIALPFTVQTITHETKGVIAPFGNTASNKHFWLRQLTENGLARATEIEPNTAYLISMPNNDAYYADFNLNGLVTFSSVDVWVPKTQIHAVDYHTEKGMVVLLPNFQRRASDYTTYALNVGEQRGDYPEGSVFEANYRDVRPFEAFTVHEGNGPAPQFIPVFDLNEAGFTGIEEVRSQMFDGRSDVWYDLNGRRLQSEPTQKGVYIKNGRKQVVK